MRIWQLACIAVALAIAYWVLPQSPSPPVETPVATVEPPADVAARQVTPEIIFAPKDQSRLPQDDVAAAEDSPAPALAPPKPPEMLREAEEVPAKVTVPALNATLPPFPPWPSKPPPKALPAAPPVPPVMDKSEPGFNIKVSKETVRAPPKPPVPVVFPEVESPPAPPVPLEN